MAARTATTPRRRLVISSSAMPTQSPPRTHGTSHIVKPYHDYDVSKAPKPMIDLEQLGFFCIYRLLDCEK